MSLLLFFPQISSLFKPHHWTGSMNIHNPPLYSTISRCEYKPDVFDYKLVVPSISEVAAYDKHTHSFSDLMDLRSLDLLSKQERCFILYSGGVDSTGLMVSIMKNWSKEDQKRVTIVCTPHSYYEFPDFFKVLNKNFTIELCKNSYKTYTNRGILVTGIQADLLFPHSWWQDKAWNLGEDVVFGNYKDKMPLLFEYMFPNFGKKVFEYYHEIVVNPVYEINNVADFCYWFWFSQYYQKVALLLWQAQGAIDDKPMFDRIFNFYDWPMFETWSIANAKAIVTSELPLVKKSLKDYIVQYTHLPDYYYKPKVPSNGNTHSGNRYNIGLDEDWNLISMQESLKYLKN
jgi:hypothetical protein